MSALNLNESDQLPTVLLELCQYPDEELIQSSLQLLDKFYTLQTNLLCRATQTELLVTSNSIQLYKEIDANLLSSLRDYLDWKNVMIEGSSRYFPSSTRLSPLQTLTLCCCLTEEAEGCEPHQQNQKIIYNFGECMWCLASG